MAVVIAVLVALVASTVAVVQSVRLSRTQSDVAALEAEVDELERRLQEQDAAGGLDDLLGGLLGEDAGALDDLLGGLLGEGGLEDLEGLLGGSLDDLLGEGGLDDLLGDSGLDDLLGGFDLSTIACVGTPSGGGEGDLPDETRAAIDVIADQVAAERGLAFSTPVEAEILDEATLGERVRTLTEEDYTPEDADVDARLLTGLGAIAPGTDLRSTMLDLLAGQVAGFYDPDTGELVAVGTDDLDATTTITLAHELDHALTDQALGMPDLDGFDGDADAGLAALSLIEGDATLLMQRWAMAHLSLTDQLAAGTGGGDQQAQLESMPHVLQQQLLFPYITGMGFVCDRFADGGWGAVDAAYRELPTTTAQILWPERYADAEAAVDLTDPVVPDGWELLRRDTLGAADLLWLFEAPGDRGDAALDDPRGRASAWAGGEVAVAGRGSDTVLGIALADRGGAPALCESIEQWYRAAFPAAEDAETGEGEVAVLDGPSQDAVLRCPGTEVRLGVGPDVTTARAASR